MNTTSLLATEFAPVLQPVLPMPIPGQDFRVFVINEFGTKVYKTADPMMRWSPIKSDAELFFEYEAKRLKAKLRLKGHQHKLVSFYRSANLEQRLVEANA